MRELAVQSSNATNSASQRVYLNNEFKSLQVEITRIADNTTCVDAQGVIVPCGSPDAVMTEYEYYMQMLGVSVVIADMVEQKILWADSEGRFN
jgi:hypothetical protein